MKTVTSILLVFAVLVFHAPAVFASGDDPALPYAGEASDKSLEATDQARKLLLSDRATMKGWTTEQWRSWADDRFGAGSSPDGTTWRDWKKARIKSSSNHTVLSGLDELNQPAVNWGPDEWGLFIDNIDTDYQSPDRYFSVILPDGQQKGKFLLGRWAYSMYEGNLPERQTWELIVSGGGSGIMSDEAVELLQRIARMQQANAEMTSFLAGLLTAMLVAVTWRV